MHRQPRTLTQYFICSLHIHLGFLRLPTNTFKISAGKGFVGGGGGLGDVSRVSIYSKSRGYGREGEVPKSRGLDTGPTTSYNDCVILVGFLLLLLFSCVTAREALSMTGKPSITELYF